MHYSNFLTQLYTLNIPHVRPLDERRVNRKVINYYYQQMTLAICI